MTRRLAPYAVALGGAVAVTAGIGGIRALGSVTGLSAVYLLLVLWVAARWGRGPAIAASVASFLFHDYFFVPPIGTFARPRRLLLLLVASVQQVGGDEGHDHQAR